MKISKKDVEYVARLARLELTEEEKGLFAPPQDVDGFRQLAQRVCAGKLVQKLMD